MKNLYKPGLFLALLGLGVLAVPWVFPVCQGMLETVAGKTVPMRCFWTARAGMILGGLILAASLLMTFAKSVEGRRLVSRVISLMGLAVILTPLYLIPTCMDPNMACNIGSRPAWIILGGLVILASLWSGRAEKPRLDLQPA